MAIINGGPGPDPLQGTSDGDLIHGFAGDDSIFGGDGDDRLFGDEGNDKLNGGPGMDAMTGGPGSDEFVPGPGYGYDTITDFNFQEDHMLLPSGATGWLFVDGDNDTVLSHPEGVLVLADFDLRPYVGDIPWLFPM